MSCFRFIFFSLFFLSGSLQAKGIVICAGGEKYLTNAWVNLHFLRETGCQLPVEIWHIGPDEINEEWVQLFSPLDVTFHDVTEHYDFPIKGWVCKPCALMATDMEEVLLLDADNIPLRDPTFLFDEPVYLETGALFWPDIMWIKKTNPIWNFLGLKKRNLVGQESGQLVVDKQKSVEPLLLVLELNENSFQVYKWLYGDKDTYLLSWMKLGARFHMVNYFPATVRNRRGKVTDYIQRDMSGEPLFLHLIADEWSLSEGYRLAGKTVEFSRKPYEHTLKNTQEVYFYDGTRCIMANGHKRDSFAKLYPEVESKGLGLLSSLKDMHKDILNTK